MFTGVHGRSREGPGAVDVGHGAVAVGHRDKCRLAHSHKMTEWQRRGVAIRHDSADPGSVCTSIGSSSFRVRILCSSWTLFLPTSLPPILDRSLNGSLAPRWLVMVGPTIDPSIPRPATRNPHSSRQLHRSAQSKFISLHPRLYSREIARADGSTSRNARSRPKSRSTLRMCVRARVLMSARKCTCLHMGLRTGGG